MCELRTHFKHILSALVNVVVVLSSPHLIIEMTDPYNNVIKIMTCSRGKELDHSLEWPVACMILFIAIV